MKLNINGIEVVIGEGLLGNEGNPIPTNTVRVNRTNYHTDRKDILTNKDIASIAVILNKADRDIADLLTVYHEDRPNDGLLKYGIDSFIATVVNTSEVLIGNKIIKTAGSIIAEVLAKNINHAITKLTEDILIVHITAGNAYRDNDAIVIYDANNNFITSIPFKP